MTAFELVGRALTIIITIAYILFIRVYVFKKKKQVTISAIDFVYFQWMTGWSLCEGIEHGYKFTGIVIVILIIWLTILSFELEKNDKLNKKQ